MTLNLPATPLFDSSGVPSNALVGLLALTGITARDPMEILAQTQARWRKPDLAAAQIPEEFGDQKAGAIPFFTELGLLGELPLPNGDFSDVIVFSGTYVAIHKRLAYMINGRKKSKARWMLTTYLASSGRERFAKDKETDEIITAPVKSALDFWPGWTAPTVLPATEAELVPYVLDQVGHHRLWPQSGERFAVTTEKTSKGTLRAYAEQFDPRGESLLVISSQPHGLRQCMEAAAILGDRFKTYHLAGYGTADGDVHVSKTLDEIAKMIFDLLTPQP